MSENPFETPPEWDPRSEGEKFGDGWRRAKREFLRGLDRLEMGPWKALATLGCFGLIVVLVLAMILMLVYFQLIEPVLQAALR